MKLPKIDLHLHVDGSMSVALAYQLAKERRLPEGEWDLERFEQEMVVPERIHDLWEYLHCFRLPIVLLQDADALYRTTVELIKRLYAQGLVYAEIRFAPQHHTKQGLTQREAVEAVLRGMKDALRECPGFLTQLILCMMVSGPSSENRQQNEETVYLAKELLGHGVCAVDLAGAEGLNPMEEYEPLFQLASSLGLPFTVHAGESGPAHHVELALKWGAKRIGHGGHVWPNQALVQQLIDRQVTLEMCVTSNIQCKNQPSFEQHALKPLYQAGVRTTINTDNMTLSNITLDQEYERIIQTMGLSEADIKTMIGYAADASFTPQQWKDEFHRKYF